MHGASFAVLTGCVSLTWAVAMVTTNAETDPMNSVAVATAAVFMSLLIFFFYGAGSGRLLML